MALSLDPQLLARLGMLLVFVAVVAFACENWPELRRAVGDIVSASEVRAMIGALIVRAARWLLGF
jgi:type IV secretory pathway TrbL component